MHRENRLERVTVVAPTLPRARAAAAAIRRRLPGTRVSPVAVKDLLARASATGRLALCPRGASVERDIAFLSRVSARILWSAPEADLHGAVAGLLGRELPDSLAPVERGKSRRKVALLLEGRVTPRRVREALESDVRRWIVESARSVRLSQRELARLKRLGVEWSVLQPVSVVGVLATPALARARRRWRRLLPPGTPVWVWDGKSR
jgi:hypothetical protein